MTVDLLTTAIAAQQVVRHGFLATDLLYRAGDDSVELAGTKGRSLVEVVDESGTVTVIETLDLIFRVEDLVIDGDPVEPQPGHVVEELTADGRFRQFEVMQLGAERCWRYTSPQRLDLRIHTKQTGDAQLLLLDRFGGSGDLDDSLPDAYGSDTWTVVVTGDGEATRAGGLVTLTPYAWSYVDVTATPFKVVARVRADGATATPEVVGGKYALTWRWVAVLDPAGGTFRLMRRGASDVTLATAAVDLSVGTWYRVELTVDVDARELSAKLLSDDGATSLASLSATDTVSLSGSPGLHTHFSADGQFSADFLRVEEV